MSKKWVIDRLLPQIKEVKPENITNSFSKLTILADIDYGGHMISTIVWRRNIFVDKLSALKALKEQLNNELFNVQYEINSLDKIEEKKNER